jgi:hypothetical protein
MDLKYFLNNLNSSGPTRQFSLSPSRAHAARTSRGRQHGDCVGSRRTVPSWHGLDSAGSAVGWASGSGRRAMKQWPLG